MSEAMNAVMRIVPAKPVFRFVSYWSSWRRVLMMQNGWYLEVQVTPVNESMASSWLEVPGLMLFWHCTPPAILGSSRGDRFSKEIPANYQAMMAKHLSPDTIECLMSADIWSKIDFRAFLAYQTGDKYRGGGIPIGVCLTEKASWAQDLDKEAEKARQEPVVCIFCDDRSNDYCNACGTPHGASLNMALSE